MAEAGKLGHDDSYRWVIAVAAFFCMIVGIGIGNAPNVQYILPVTDEMGFSRADFSLTFSLRYAFTTIVSLFWAKILARLGVRRMCGLGFICLAGAFFIFSTSSGLPMFYTAAALQGAAIALCTSATCSYLVGNWFTDKIGAVLGVVLAASGIGGGIGNFLVARWISASGWRFSYRLTAFAILGIGLVLTAFIRVRPHVSAPRKSSKKKTSTEWEGLPVEILRRQAYFYVFSVMVFIMGWMCNPVYTITPAALIDHGFDPIFAGQITGLVFTVLGGAKVVYGVLYDRWGLRPVFLLNCAMGIAAQLLLAWIPNRSCAVVFAVLLGFALPIETVMIPLLVRGLLGRKASVTHIGIFFALVNGGIATGSPLINFGCALTGSYTPVLIVFAGIFVGCALLFLWCESQMKKLKKQTAPAKA